MKLDNTQRTLCEAALALISDGKVLRDCSRLLGVRRSTLHDWLTMAPEMAGNYARAREKQADAMAEDLYFMAQDKNLDPKHRKVAFDCGLKVLSRWFPEKYGEAVLLRHEVVNEAIPLTQEEIIARLGVALQRPLALQLHHSDPMVEDADFSEC